MVIRTVSKEFSSSHIKTFDEGFVEMALKIYDNVDGSKMSPFQKIVK